MADSRKIYAYGVGTLQITSSVNGLECQQELEDVYYAPGVHVWLVSLGKLEGQGWGVSLREGRMELRGQEGDMFASVEKVNNVYLMEASVIPPRSMLAAWTDEDKQVEMTHNELIQHLETVVLAAMSRGGNGMAASLMTWHQCLGHTLFKTVVALAQGSTSGMVITDLPVTIPGLDTCAACIAAKSVHLPHKTDRRRADKFLE